MTLSNYIVWMSRKVHNLRIAAGLTPKQLDKKANLPSGYIKRFELGLCSPSFVVREKLAKALGISADELEIPN